MHQQKLNLSRNDKPKKHHNLSLKTVQARSRNTTLQFNASTTNGKPESSSFCWKEGTLCSYFSKSQIVANPNMQVIREIQET
jgi:hypothetical protein